MTSLLSALAVSAITHIIPPNVTLTLSQTSGAMLVAVSGADLAQAALDTPSSYLYALPARALGEVERGLQLRSPVDLALYAAPLGALVWNSSPTLRAVTHEAGALIHQISTAIRNVMSRLLVRYASPSDSISPSTFVSAPGFSLDGHLNYSSIVNASSRPVFGPEWEWYPRDLVVFVPQPSCPVPVLQSDMSTLPTLDRCGLDSQDHYADIIRSAMRGKSSIDSRFDWCGRGSEALEEELKQAVHIRRELSRKEVARRHKLVIESARQRELAQLGSVYECKGAWQPLALCFAALMIVYGLLTYAFTNVSDLYKEKKNILDDNNSLAPPNPTNHYVPQPQTLDTTALPQPPVVPSPPFIGPSLSRVEYSPPRVNYFPPTTLELLHHEPESIVEDPPEEPSSCTSVAQAEQDQVFVGLEEVDQVPCEEERKNDEGKPQDEELDLPPLPPSPPPSPPLPPLPSTPIPELSDPELDSIAPVALPKSFSWADDVEELERHIAGQRDQTRLEDLARKEEECGRKVREQREREKKREESEREDRAREEERIEKEHEEREREMEKLAKKKREEEWRAELKLSLAEKERAEASKLAERKARWEAMGGGQGWIASLSPAKSSTCAHDDAGFETVLRRKKGLGPNQGVRGGGRSGAGNGGRLEKHAGGEAGTNGAGHLGRGTRAPLGV